MGNPKAFLEIHRQEAGYRPIHDRIHDFGEVEQTLWRGGADALYSRTQTAGQSLHGLRRTLLPLGLSTG